MTHHPVSAETAGRRENARRGDGKFGHQHHAEANVSLDGPSPYRAAAAVKDALAPEIADRMVVKVGVDACVEDPSGSPRFTIESDPEGSRLVLSECELREDQTVRWDDEVLYGPDTERSVRIDGEDATEAADMVRRVQIADTAAGFCDPRYIEGEESGTTLSRMLGAPVVGRPQGIHYGERELAEVFETPDGHEVVSNFGVSQYVYDYDNGSHTETQYEEHWVVTRDLQGRLWQQEAVGYNEEVSGGWYEQGAPAPATTDQAAELVGELDYSRPLPGIRDRESQALTVTCDEEHKDIRIGSIGG